MKLLLAALLSAAPVSSWPTDLTSGWTALTVKKSTPGEAPRIARLERGPDGVWKVLAPWKGEADVLAIGRLQLALEAPQLVSAEPAPPTPASFEIELRQGKRVRHVTTRRAGLNAPVPVTVDGKSFAVAPVELSIKLPDPDDFAPPGLWIAAKDDAISIEVQGPATYKLVGKGKDWKPVDRRVPTRALDGVVGVVVARQAIAHPLGVELEALGLAKPEATATVCTAKSCRVFKFGRAQGRYYAIAPDSDPLELRDNDWKVLVEGPFVPPGAP